MKLRRSDHIAHGVILSHKTPVAATRHFCPCSLFAAEALFCASVFFLAVVTIHITCFQSLSSLRQLNVSVPTCQKVISWT